MSAPTANVNITLPVFRSLYEGSVAWDACGPVANEVAIASLEGRLPDAGNAQRARARDIAAGRFTAHSGQPLSDILWDIQQRGYSHFDYIPFSSAPDINALHAFVKNAALNRWPVIIEVSRAYNLPDNEARVQYHFVVIGGIDSVLGYLIANGDMRASIAANPGFPACSQQPVHWATWATLVSAGICGAIAVKPQNWSPTPAPAPIPPAPPAPAPAPAAPVAPDYAAEIAALQAQIAAQIATLTSNLASATGVAQSAQQQAQQALNAFAGLRATLHGV